MTTLKANLGDRGWSCCWRKTWVSTIVVGEHLQRLLVHQPTQTNHTLQVYTGICKTAANEGT